MEEEKKEEGCCENKKMFHKHHHGCCGHKAIRAIILALIIFSIFSVGVCVGSHANRNFEGRGYGFRTFNNEQGNGGRMMKGYNNNSKDQAGGCRFKNNNQTVGSCPMMQNGGSGLAAPIQATCPMQAQIQTQLTAPTPVKTVTPAK